MFQAEMKPEKRSRSTAPTEKEFLRTEVAVAQIYADLAERQRNLGLVEAADSSLSESEISYTRMRRALYILRLRDAAFGSPLSHNSPRGGAEAEANEALWIQSARASPRNRSCPGAATMGEIPTLAVVGSRSKPLL